MKIIHLIAICWVMCISCQGSDQANLSAKDRWWTPQDQQLILTELDRTTSGLKAELEDLSEKQWHFREDRTRWSIAEIVEHLEIQNQLHYREISVISKSPQYLKFRDITAGHDSHFTKYANDTTKSEARWFLQPRGRYDSIEAGWSAFLQARNELRKFVANTDIDLRKQFTFRIAVQGKDIKDISIGEVRDLHQLLLTGIAHTDRHLTQIRNLKNHPEFASVDAN